MLKYQRKPTLVCWRHWLHIKLWMNSGTSVKLKYIRVHALCETLATPQDLTNIIQTMRSQYVIQCPILLVKENTKLGRHSVRILGSRL